MANLLLARAVERERDMGIRAALGAKPGRLMRMVVTEGFVLASLSGALALLVAWWTQSLVGAFAIPIAQPQHVDLTPDANVIGFITALVAIAGVLPGVWPAIAAARVDVMRVLGSQGANSAGGRPSPLRRWLVGAQIAGSTVFLVVAALFVQSYSSVAATDLGFERERMVVAELEPALHGYSADATERYIDDPDDAPSHAAGRRRRGGGRPRAVLHRLPTTDLRVAAGRRVRRRYVSEGRSPTPSARRTSGRWASRCARGGNSTAAGPPERSS